MFEFVKDITCLELIAIVSIVLTLVVFLYRLISEKTELRENLYWEYPYSFTDHIGKHCCRDYRDFEPMSDEEAHYRHR